MMRKLALALLVGTALSPVLFTPGCGGSSSPVDAGKDGKDGGNDAKAGTGGGAGTTGAGGGTAGTTGAGGMDGGAAGMDAAAGTGGVDAPVDMAPDSGVDATPVDLRPDGGMGLAFMFDTSIQGWYFTKYGSSPDNSPNVPNNLATLSGAPVWDMTNDADNKTTSGSLKGTIPFKSVGDRIDFQAFSFTAAKYDWTGYTISAKVKLVSGGNIAAGCPMQAWLYVSQATDYKTTPRGGGGLVNLQTGTWVTVNLDLASAGVNTAAINQMGVQIDTGPACGSNGGGDGGTDGGADGGDGGADASDASDAAVDAASVDGDGDASTDAVDAATDLLVDAGLGDVIDGGEGGVVVPVTATTAVILIDNVIVSVK